jgi:Kdo2-lipid IVA lauroyltransferase/acyltransferase
MARAGLDNPSGRATQMYVQLGRSVVELLALSSFAKDDRERFLEQQVTSPEEELLVGTMRAPGPVLILASHTGNWELAAAAAKKKWIGPYNREVVLVAKALHSRAFDRFMRRLRVDLLGLRTIDPSGGQALRLAARALREGHVVVMPIDQVPESSSIVAPFLDANALVDKAPATLAWRTKATILVVGASRDPDDPGLHRLHVIDHVASRGTTGTTSATWIEETTRTATRALDRFVRAHPEGWLWLHRRWKMPAAPPKAASVERSIRLDGRDLAAEASACRKAPVRSPSFPSARF